MRLVHKGSLGALPSLCRLALGCAVGVALCAHAADTKQPPRDEKTAPKRGVTIEEQPSRTIIYFEESGGIILPTSKKPVWWTLPIPSSKGRRIDLIAASEGLGYLSR